MDRRWSYPSVEGVDMLSPFADECASIPKRPRERFAQLKSSDLDCGHKPGVTMIGQGPLVQTI